MLEDISNISHVSVLWYWYEIKINFWPSDWQFSKLVCGSGVTGGGGGNFCWSTGKKRGKEKGKRGENWKMEIFYREKAFHAGKKSGKITLPPQKNFPVTPLVCGRAVCCWAMHNLSDYPYFVHLHLYRPSRGSHSWIVYRTNIEFHCRHRENYTK